MMNAAGADMTAARRLPLSGPDGGVNDEQPSDLFQSEQCAERLKALAEPLRLQIVAVLQEQPRNVGEIAEALGVELMIASHHLGILRNAGFVERQKQGRFAVYKLKPGISARGNIDLGCCQLSVPKAKPKQG